MESVRNEICLKPNALVCGRLNALMAVGKREPLGATFGCRIFLLIQLLGVINCPLDFYIEVMFMPQHNKAYNVLDLIDSVKAVCCIRNCQQLIHRPYWR